MNSVLKQLSRKGITKLEVATAIEKHVGSGIGEYASKQAFDSLRRIKDREMLALSCVTIRLICSDGSYSDKLKIVLRDLRR